MGLGADIGRAFRAGYATKVNAYSRSGIHQLLTAEGEIIRRRDAQW